MAKQISEVVNGERIVRDMTKQEEAEFDAAAEIDRANMEAFNKIVEDKKAARASALAKLAALGLSADEIAAL
jgi:hypothetical protein